MAIMFLTYVSVAYALWRLVRRYVAKTSLDNIPGPPSESLVTGNFMEMFHPDAWKFHSDITAKYGGIIKVHTLFGGKQLYVSDPKALHQILIKDQHIFEESAVFLETNRAIFGDGVFSAVGDNHRRQRKLLNPIFSPTHLREMVPVFYEGAHRLRAALAARVSKGPREIDILQWVSRTSLELVGQAGVGCSFDSLVDDTTTPYVRSVKELQPTISRMAIAIAYMLVPALKIGTLGFRKFVMNILPWNNLQRLRDATNMMHETSVQIFQAKKRALEAGEEIASKIGAGKDIISILMHANVEAAADERMTDTEVIAQMSTLIFAAMDTTSGAMSRVLHLVSQHIDVQEKLRQEISAARKEFDRDLTYEELVALPYLDAVCRETLRLYPPVSVILRSTLEDAVIPLASPIKGVDGNDVHEVHVKKDSDVFLSILAINRNAEIWGPDALEWKPERWLAPLPDSVTNARVPGVYSNMMTFIGGGRSCIGFKFAEAQLKVIVSFLLESFKFETNEREIIWNMGVSVSTPDVRHGKIGRSQLPLKISLLDSAK